MILQKEIEYILYMKMCSTLATDVSSRKERKVTQTNNNPDQTAHIPDKQDIDLTNHTNRTRTVHVAHRNQSFTCRYVYLGV